MSKLIYPDDFINRVICGDCINVMHQMPDEVVQCCPTSPPFWGLRDYGLDPVIWDGDPECQHEWGTEKIKTVGSARDMSGGFGNIYSKDHGTHGLQPSAKAVSMDASQGQFCQHCGAWLGSLGLEPTPELYIDHLVQIFREVRRVLRKDGTLWVNIGDSYAGSGRDIGSAPDPKWKKARNDDMKHKQDWKAIDLKPKDLVLIPFRLALALQADGWWIRSDIIWAKCLSGGARVYAKTQKGEMPMTIKDMVRLDPSTVKLWNGKKWTQVVSWMETSRPEQPIEIQLRSGEKIGCTPDHRWPTQRGIIQASELQIGDIIDTCRLPEPDKPKSPEMLQDEEIGWFIGLYLAEGSRGSNGNCIQITSHIDEAQERYRRLSILADDYHGTCALHELEGKSATVNLYSKVLNGIIDTYISGHTAKDKHLSAKCWERSGVFLFCLLSGYLEGDGHHDEKNDRWRLGFTRNTNLADDLRTLCARLGINIRLKTSHAICEGKRYPAYRGKIRFEVSDHGNAKQDSEIVAIGKSNARKFWDIAVEDDPHLFALASGVLTHNSNPMPESVRDRPTKAHEYVFLCSKSKQYYYDQDAIREPVKQATIERSKYGWNGKTGDAKIYGRRAGSMWKNAGNGEKFNCYHPKGRNRRTVWTIPTKSFPEAHFAVFPEKLIEPMILAGSKPGDIVFDPFMGAGTTGVVAKKLGRRWIGIDASAEYCHMAERRIRDTVQQPDLPFRGGDI